jgi:hypothetical protein
MPELVRSLARRLRELVGNRRHAPRYCVRLACGITLLNPKNGVESAAAVTTTSSSHKQLPVFNGYTRDLSATGLAIVVPAIRIGEHYLTGEGHNLRIALELPSAVIELHATPMRYEQLEKGGDEIGYLIGAHITAISDHDRALFLEHLKKQR